MSLGFAFVVSMIRLAATSVRLAERGMWINEGERRQVQREMEAVLKALKQRDKIHDKVDKETDEQVLEGLRSDGDLRPDERLPQ
jgi:hypothetical protein